MNIKIKSKQSAEHGKARFSKLIANSAAVSLGLVLAVAGLFLGVPGVQAQTKLSTADTAFILAAAQGGMTEVKMGELAAQKGMRDDVKAFGNKMVKDHTVINDSLKALAAQKGVALPDSLDAKHQAMVDKMAVMMGTAFDDAYIAGMTKDHKADAKEFKAESAETKDTEIKSFLDKSIPVVEEHLKLISAMKK